LQKRLDEIGAPAFSTPRQDFRKLIEADTAKWAQVVKFANIQLD
jgi:tripartite-type tricarboxylate transporter receptor subunit TctC